MTWIKAILTLLIRPCLPEKFRKLWTWPSVWSNSTSAHASAYCQAVVALTAWMSCFVVYVHHYGERVSEMIADPNGSGEVGAITFYGLPMFFSFFFTPLGILLTIFLIDSAVRFIHVIGTGEASGSIFMVAPLFLAGKILDALNESKLTSRFGPADLPDRVSPEIDGSLVIRCSRPHPDWSPLLTYSWNDVLYELINEHAEPVVEANSFLYEMKPWSDGKTVRRIVLLKGVPE